MWRVTLSHFDEALRAKAGDDMFNASLALAKHARAAGLPAPRVSPPTEAASSICLWFGYVYATTYVPERTDTLVYRVNDVNYSDVDTAVERVAARIEEVKLQHAMYNK